MIDNSCGRCAHCANRHGSYRTNDGVCLLIGVTVRKSENSQGCRPCGIKWSGEVMDYVPKGFDEATDSLEKIRNELEMYPAMIGDLSLEHDMSAFANRLTAIMERDA